jgi:hypothetical protein
MVSVVAGWIEIDAVYDLAGVQVPEVAEHHEIFAPEVEPVIVVLAGIA